MKNSLSMVHGTTTTLEFTFPDGDVLTGFTSFRFFAWDNSMANRWGVSGASGGGSFVLSGQVLTVTLDKSTTSSLTLSDALSGFSWDLRAIDASRDLVVSSGSLQMASSPSLDTT